MRVRELINKIVDSQDNSKMYEMQDVFEDLLCSLKEYNKDKYEHYKDKLYCIAYGPIVNDEMRKEIVEKIGEHWSIEDTENVRIQYNLNNLDKNEFNVVMNMSYSDYKDVFGDNLELYVKFSNAFIDDKDAIDGKVYYYFKNLVK